MRSCKKAVARRGARPIRSLSILWPEGSPRTVRRHLEGEVERRQILAGVVLVIGELRDEEVPRPRLHALVDAGIEIDVVPARRAGCLDDDFDIALAVERADITGVVVVIHHM